MWNKCTIPDVFLNECSRFFFFSYIQAELTMWTEHILPLSCQSTSLCLGDKVSQLSEWMFGGCFDWHVALEQQKSASRFPGTLLVWLREPLWEVSSSHCCSVSPFLQATVSGIIYLWQWSCLECVCLFMSPCMCVCVGICGLACVLPASARVHVAVCHMGVPRTIRGAEKMNVFWT